MSVIIKIIFCTEVFVFEMLHTNSAYYNPQACSIRIIWTQFGMIITVLWDVKACSLNLHPYCCEHWGATYSKVGIDCIIRELLWSDIFL